MSQLHSENESAVSGDGTAGPAYYNFDPVALDYDRSRYLPPEVLAQIARRIEQAAGLGAGQVLLDAGVGTGRFALPLARMGVPVIGIDVSTNMLEQLRIKAAHTEGELPLRLVRGDLRHLPFASHSLGAALMVHILHLIVDWRSAVAQVRRVLVPGAPLLLAWESGNRVPTRDYYFQLARQRGRLGNHQGARNADAVGAYLAEIQASVEPIDTSDIHWRSPYPVAQTLDYLARRSWSNLWKLPEEEHAFLMKATENWVQETYGTTDTTEEAEGALMLWVARWQDEL